MFSKPNASIAGKKSLQKLNIQTLNHLSLLLGSSPTELQKFADSDKAFQAGFFFDKKGKKRPKAEPVGRLKPILRTLNNLLQRLDLPTAVHGGRLGRSNLTNALPHRRKEVVLSFDIRDFFPSITPQDVFDVFHRRCGCKPEIARLMARITTFDNQLAQGSPPSTIIAALVAERLIKRIEKLVRLHGGQVTLYVDDINISGPNALAALKPKIIEIIVQEGFQSHPDKSLVQGRNKDQVVTGVRVNDQLDVSTDRMSTIRKQTLKLENLLKMNRLLPSDEVGELIGQMAYLSRLNPGAAKHYGKRIKRLEENLLRNRNLAGRPANS